MNMATACGACPPTPRRKSRAIARTFSPPSVSMRRHDLRGSHRARRGGAQVRQMARRCPAFRATPPASSRPLPPIWDRRSREAPTTCFQRDVFETALDYLSQLRPLCHPKSPDRNPIKTYDAMSSGDDIVYTPFGFGYTNYSRRGAKKPIRYTTIAGPGPDPSPARPWGRRLRDFGPLPRCRGRGRLSRLAPYAGTSGRRLFPEWRAARAPLRVDRPGG